MFPFFEQPSLHLGPITIHAFGAAVAAGVWVASSMAERRFEHAGLDLGVSRRLSGWILAAGLLGAHLFSVLLYFPQKLRADPWLLLRVWEDISSFGGMLGGVLGALLFFTVRAPHLTTRTRLVYLDAIAFVFPFGLALGRLGCALAHDHPGVVTSFPLAISLRSPAAQAYIQSIYETAEKALPPEAAAMGFHDLGFYEFLFLAIVVIPAFVMWNRRKRPAGFYLVTLAALYLPVRFGLDLLRVADARYVRLTPAQWVAALTLAALPLLTMNGRKVRFAISGIVILGTAWACWGGPR
jgi:phosphatidylglycerol:prolipoprotein diacylglycerol transferase